MKHQVKQVNNKKLLSFDDEEEEDGLNGPVVSFQQASGVVKKEDLKREIKIEKKEDLKREIKIEKKEESPWVQKMKAKLRQKEKEK